MEGLESRDPTLIEDKVGLGSMEGGPAGADRLFEGSRWSWPEPRDLLRSVKTADLPRGVTTPRFRARIGLWIRRSDSCVGRMPLGPNSGASKFPADVRSLPLQVSASELAILDRLNAQILHQFRRFLKLREQLRCMRTLRRRRA